MRINGIFTPLGMKLGKTETMKQMETVAPQGKEEKVPKNGDSDGVKDYEGYIKEIEYCIQTIGAAL